MSQPSSPFIGYLGVITLTKREIGRFVKVKGQTIFSPVVTSLIFLAIFTLALGQNSPYKADIAFTAFIAPGLVMTSIQQNAFANTSSSLITLKIQGNIIDLLMAPLNAWELVLGFMLGGIARGLVVGALCAAAMALFVPMSIDVSLALYVLYHAVFAATAFAALGIITGIWAEKFEHMSAITNFFITPLSLLSGTFYSIESLPDPWQSIARISPFFQTINGFRYGFTGYTDGDLLQGVFIVTLITFLLIIIAWRLFSTGFYLKS